MVGLGRGSRGWASSCCCWCSIRRSSRRCSTSSRRCPTARRASASKRCSRAADSRARGLFVMDGSRRSGHGNAYFTGFGRAKRIVFFDTLLERLTEDEIEAVLAHELGHFKLRHVIKRISWSAVLSLAFLALLAWLAAEPWFYAGLGIPPSGRAAAMARPGVALALFLLALPVFTFVLEPLGVAVLAPARVRGRRVRRAQRLRRGADAGARQAVRGQRRDADARPAAFGVLRLASAGGDPRRAAGVARCGAATGLSPSAMRARSLSLLLALVAASAAAQTPAPFAGGDPKTGAAMHGEGLLGCHAAALRRRPRLYTRIDRRVTTPAQLKAQIAYCNSRARHRLLPRRGRAHRRVPRPRAITSSSHERTARATVVATAGIGLDDQCARARHACGADELAAQLSIARPAGRTRATGSRRRSISPTTTRRWRS